MIPKPWADQPLPMIETPALTRDKTHAAIHIATEMALVHNCLLRGLNSIYLQASHVTNPVDIKDFLFFCHVWGKSTDNHHDTEEQFIFPAVEAFAKQPGIMDKNREQHQAFHDGLEAFKTYSAETQPEDYNPVKLREILDTFVKPFQQHLKEEIDTLVALENLESTGLSKLWKAAEAKASGSVRKDEVFPLILGCNDRTFENSSHNFPPVPYFVTLIIKFWFGRTHAGAWRFCPSDIFGQPRPLMFLPSEE